MSDPLSALLEARAEIESKIAGHETELARVNGAIAKLQPTERRKPRAPLAPRAGGRAEQVLKAVKANPGTTVTEIAKRLKTSPSNLYAVFAKLTKDGALRKDGKGFTAI